MSDYDGMGYEELLDECEWMSDFLSLMAERITKDPDVHNLVDYVRKIEDENAKLREQLDYERQTSRSRLEKIDRFKEENDKLRQLVEDLYFDLLGEMPESMLEDRRSQMRELGIEVD